MQGASPLVSDHCGRNAIKIAAKSGHNHIVKLLEQFCPNKNESNIKNFILFEIIFLNKIYLQVMISIQLILLVVLVQQLKPNHHQQY